MEPMDILAVAIGFSMVIHAITWVVLIGAWDEIKKLRDTTSTKGKPWF